MADGWMRPALRARPRPRTLIIMSDMITPTPEAVRAAEGALPSLSNHEPAGVVLRVRENGGSAEVDLPREVLPLLVEILGQIAIGNGVRVVPLHAELTPPQAAEICSMCPSATSSGCSRARRSP